jgi:hypothetical protein
VLLIGRCVEVWADPRAACRSLSAVRRYRGARDWWLKRASIERLDEQQSLIPHGAPWSVDYLSYRGQAERSGVSVSAIVAERLVRAGAMVDDLPALQREATRLLKATPR